jgi:hypothetical protein
MNDNQKFWLGLILIIGIISSAYFGFKALSNDPVNDLLYNEFEFIQGPDGFYYVELNTAVGDSHIPFYYHPRSLENLSYDQNITTELFFVQRRNGVVRIALDTEFLDDPYIVVAGVEISKITGRVFAMPTASGFTSDVENITKVFTCADANNTTFVIELRKGDENKAVSNGTCAILYSTSGRDAVMMADLFVYKTLGVMK